MTYIEMCYKIKELLYYITNSLNIYNMLVIYYNGSLLNSNLRGDLENIRNEINNYLTELINECQMELIILKRLDDYITKIVLDYTEVFFEDSEEFHLFEKIIKRINNSFMMRLKSDSYVFDRYTNLIKTNSFNNQNYKILKREKYISEEEYQSYLNLHI